MMVAVLSFKCNYHVDEILNYGLSNHQGGHRLVFEDGKKYMPGEELFMEYLTVQPEHKFDYNNVWKNQSGDVHPPFYYAIVHTICSFFPKEFSLWFAGIVNIIFSLLVLYILRKLSYFFLDNFFLINIVSFAFVFCAGILSAVSFLRMYIAAMFWVLLLTYYYVKAINENEVDKFSYLKISLVTLAGALTHYYCTLYAVLIAVLYGLYLLMWRKFKEAGFFCCAMAAAGTLSYLIFPAMIRHMFFGYRGKEVLHNASKFSDFLVRLKAFYVIIDKQLFGGFLGALLLVILFLLFKEVVLRIRSKTIKERLSSVYHNKLVMSYVFMLFPSILYFVIVSKITSYLTDRYMFPIYAVVYCIVMFLLVNCLNRIPVFQKYENILTISLLLMITIGSWFTIQWPYLYLDKKSFLEKTAKYSAVDCICVYESRWKIVPMYLEAKNYKSIRFINYKHFKKPISNLKTRTSGKTVLSLIGIQPKKHKDYIDFILKKQKVFKSYRRLGSFAYGTSYILQK